MNRTTALLMAAGLGERFGDKEPKQFCPVNGRPVVLWPLRRFEEHGDVDGIVVVVPRGYQRRLEDMLAGNGFDKISGIVAGGETRQESVRIGLDHVRSSCENVLVHDAARPCFSRSLLDRIIEKLQESEAVVPVLPVVDTLYRESRGCIDAILDRICISRAQTPQGFKVELLCRAHEEAREKGFASSDDGSLIFFLGERVQTVAGEKTNIKITYPEDLELAGKILAMQD